MFLTELQNKLSSIKANIVDIAGEAVMETKEAYLKLNSIQLANGLDKNGAPVKLDGKEEYAQSTIDYKNKYGVGVGAITDHITLYSKGFLHKSFDLSVSGDDIYIEAGTYYSGYVLFRSTDVVLGLNSGSRTEYIETSFESALINKVKNKLSA